MRCYICRNEINPNDAWGVTEGKDYHVRCIELATPTGSDARVKNVDVAINTACEQLPEGWNICFEMERWSGWVVLYDPKGNKVPLEYDTGEPMGEWVMEALRVAKEKHQNI